MLFFLPAALAAIVLGWPCQRLNWAWRNVWVTCSINAWVPGSAAPVSASGFTMTNSAPWSSLAAGPSQLDSNGQFNPAGAAPLLCATSPNSGGTFMRNRCRRMLDTYGNLVTLCKGGPAKSPWISGADGLTPDFAPQPGHAPHATNVMQLAFFAQNCITPGASYPTPSTTCPGLAGWFTVVWNACMSNNGVFNAPGVTSTMNVPSGPNGVTYVPNYLGTSSSSSAWSLASPQLLCGTAAPTASTPQGASAYTSTQWNGKGPVFRTSRCRKALDQFGRTASRCVPANVPSGVGQSDPLRWLAQGLGTLAPFCS